MKYLNALRNQALATRSWMISTLFFAFFSAYLLTQIISMARNIPTRLVPYEFDAFNGPVEIENGMEVENQEYLTAIALSDLQNYTDWTAHNVKKQHGRFANRMTPALWAETGTRLMISAEAFSEGERTQSLYVDEIKIFDNTVRITGKLQVWQGIHRVENMNMFYELVYQAHRGMPKIAAFKAGKPDRSGSDVE